MDRRRFVESTLGAGLWLAAGACSSSDASEADAGSADARTDSDGAGRGGASGRIERWGLQLYTVRSLMAQDVERTLARIAGAGYREVEFAGYFDRTPAQIRGTLDAEGLTSPASHLSMAAFRDDLDEIIETAGIVGQSYLVLPSLDRSERGGLDEYRRVAEEMNGFGERCRAAGLRFAYHNHDYELEEMDGGVPLEALIEGTDPELVAFEVDLFWLVHGGADPFDYFARYPGRFELCHVKDRTAEGAMVDVGAGVIDFAAIFGRSDQAGLAHYFVEHDNPDDPMRSIEASITHLSSLSV